MTIDVTGYGQLKQTVLAEQRIAAVSNGDSGGPVFQPIGPNNSQATAEPSAQFPVNRCTGDCLRE